MKRAIKTVSPKVVTFVGLIGFITFVSCIRTLPRLAVEENIKRETLSADSLVSPEPFAVKADTLKPGKYIYLTIDDSPLNGSRYIDSVIRATGVRTNIFMVGNPIDGSKRFKNNYELLSGNPHVAMYNHSYSHANHRYLSYYKKPEEVLADFEKNRANFNLTHRIARLPGRNLWLVAGKTKNYKQTGAEAAQLLSDKGYKVFGWDVEWKYEGKNNIPVQTIDELLEEIENLSESSQTFTSGHIVLLMHDQMFAKANGKNNLETLIRKLQKNGYTFEYLHRYPN